MTEQTFIDLGFEKQVIPPDEVEGAYEYYYRLEIGEILLITNTQVEAEEEGWWGSIFEYYDLKIKGAGDLEDLVRVLSLNMI
jgi:hypothetical protein